MEFRDRQGSDNPTWDQVAQIAAKVGSKFPDLVAAQFALESNWGNDVSGRNNYFGIKGKGTQCKTREWNGSEYITILAEFKDFDTLEDCISDLVSKWYLDYRQYRGVNHCETIEDAAKQLVIENYATDPNYSTKLLSLVNQHGSHSHHDNYVPLERAARYYTELAHQAAAWKALQDTLTDEQKDLFTKAFRNQL